MRQKLGVTAATVGAVGAYAAMILATILGFLCINSLGSNLVVSSTAETARFEAPAGADTEVFLHVLLALVTVIVAARLLGALFRRLGQPPVIGEVIAGICLGPSLLGRLAPTAGAYVLPASVAPFLGVIAQVGVVLFMFLVGLELDSRMLRQRSHAAVAISHAGIIAPFLMGSTLALWLYPRLATRGVPFMSFALFMGVSMSVTAFPVLARILTDRRMQRTRLGIMALTCAAIDDVSAWCLLAFVVSVAHAHPNGALPTVLMTLAYIAGMFLVVRPVVWRLVERQHRIVQRMNAMVFIALLSSAFVTEFIGIHAVFGAFFLGAVIPHDSLLARDIRHKLEDFVVVMLLPAFFAFAGLRTQVGLVSGVEHWLICGAIILVACLGKFGGSSVTARLCGLSWRDAASLGVLLNTRGLMELVVLNIGLDLGVISRTLFAMMVLMALVTTVMTTPVLHILTRRSVEAESALRAAVV